MASARSHSRLVRASLALLALLLAVGPGWTLWHEAAVPHRYCAEHGVMEEAQEVTQGVTDGQLAQGIRSSNQEPSPEDEDHHRSCPWELVSLRGFAPPAAPDSMATDFSLHELVGHLASAHPSTGRDALTQAPKTSPPRS